MSTSVDASARAAKVPYYMQDDPDGDATVGSAQEDEEDEDGKHGEGKPKSVLDMFKKRKTKVRNIEVNPDIEYADFTKNGPGLESKATLTDEGMIDIWVDLKKALPDLHKDYARPVKEFATDPKGGVDCPPLSIVIFIVGSRGDVQPYLSLALHLIKSHSHRVRVATHPDFKDFVLETGKRLKGLKGKDGVDLEGRLEFYDVGGDPKELMAYMVKNPGLLPGWASLTNGDITSKRKMTAQLLDGFFRSVYSPDPISQRPFAADAIISNPPAFAHCHIAEALGIPLHMSFTMPWSPSVAFNHPLVNVKKSNAEKGLTNVLTFSFADMMQWQGLGDIINAFRGLTLGLEPLSARSGPSIMERLKIPWTYCWSEGLIKKPDDWKEHIDISGFYFLEGETDFKPAADLVEFLEKGQPPIYIGFGSVVVEDATAMTNLIFEAVKKSGIRALVNAGWGGLGGAEVPEEVFILKGNVPHDWLFAEGRVSAVCHHGGAGTTAIGLRNGLSTIVVPFFGDQKFWGDMIHRAGAGPEPIPHKELTVENLSAAIKYAVSDEAKKAAGVMGEKIRQEKGEERGVKSFHRHLPLENMRCDLTPDRIAQWWSPQLFLRLSGPAAAVLHDAGKLKLDKLEPLRAKEYQSRWRSRDPVTGGTTAILMAVSNHYASIGQLFYKPQKGVINLATTWPQGIMDIFVSVHEGFNAIPERLGSEVRERGKVEDFSSGVREAGKGLFFGWWDGITGLVTEPISGGRKEGAIGVLKGMGRSYVNVTMRPAAGITGAIALPIHGTYLSLRKAVAGTPQNMIREPREAISRLEAAQLDDGEKSKIIELFQVALAKTDERRGYYKKKAELFLMAMKKDKEEADAEEGVEGDEGDMTEEVKQEGKVEMAMGSTDGQVEVDPKKGEQEAKVKLGGGLGDGHDDPADKVSDEERKKMEEAERRGYEKAKREMEEAKKGDAHGEA